MKSSPFSHFITITRLFVIAAPIVVFFYLLNINLVPTGVFTVERAARETSPYLDRLLPDGRVEAAERGGDGNWFQKIIGDPVFFFVHPPRFFPEVKTEIRFKNTSVPIVEFGLLADAVTGAYNLKPLQNLIIDNSAWSRIEAGGVVLLQRDKKFNSIEEFLLALPNRSEIATYHFDLNEPYRLQDYVPSISSSLFSISEIVNQGIALRGSHEFYTYIKDEILNFEFVYIDENLRVGSDEVSLVVVNEDSEVVGEVGVTDNDEPFSISAAKIEIPNLPEGVYKIQMKASDDIVFRSVATSQEKMTFLNHLWISQAANHVANFEEPARAITNGSVLSFSTHLADAVQTVLVGQEPLIMSEPYFEYCLSPSGAGLTEIAAPKSDDLLINTNGLIALYEWQYFNPDPVRLTAETNLDRAGVNYIIAEYVSPRSDGEWLVAEAALSTTGAPFEDKTWKFVISAPTAAKGERELLINFIKMTFSGSPITFQRVWDKLMSYVLE